MKSAAEPSGTLLILPDGKVKVAAPIPYLCADLRKEGLIGAWRAYQKAWGDPRVARTIAELSQDESLLARANNWVPLDNDLSVVV
jgi:hypothetical protein